MKANFTGTLIPMPALHSHRYTLCQNAILTTEKFIHNKFYIYIYILVIILQEFVGMIYAIGAMASIVGVVIYHKALKNHPFRALLFFAQLLYAVSGMLDLVFIQRWNLALGIPDSFFVVLEECVSRIISRIRWMPMMVLSSQLCPLGIEGTFFALLMCIDSLGALTSKWGGGLVLHVLGVTRTDFKNLWLTVLIRNVLRFSTLGLIFLVPNVDSSEVGIQPDGDESLEMVPLNEKTQV